MAVAISVRGISLLRSTISWAKVARELFLSLSRAGVGVRITERFGERHDPNVVLPTELETLLRGNRTLACEVDFAVVSPTEFAEVFEAPVRTAFLVFEATRWPTGWVRAASRHLHAAVVPSRFCRETLIATGLPRDRVVVVPHGIDPTHYHPTPRGPEGSTLHLLFVGTPAARKGLDICLRAVERAFPTGRGVRVSIKNCDWGTASVTDWDWKPTVERLRSRGFRIATRLGPMTEPEMAVLYRSADLLVAPHRGEGFGMTILEAMACGTPAAVTGWSGVMDFVTDANGFLLKRFADRPAAGLIPEKFGALPDDSRMVEPDVDELAALLSRLAVDRGLLRDRGASAATDARLWTWDCAARRMIEDVLRPLAQEGSFT